MQLGKPAILKINHHFVIIVAKHFTTPFKMSLFLASSFVKSFNFIFFFIKKKSFQEFPPNWPWKYSWGKPSDFKCPTIWLTLNKGNWLFSWRHKSSAHDLHQVTADRQTNVPTKHIGCELWGRVYMFQETSVPSLSFLPEEKVKLYCCWGKGLFLQPD